MLYGYDPETAVWVKIITAFMTAPRLRSITLSSSGPGLFESQIQMPWSQLTTLHITEPFNPADTCQDASLKCTNLVDRKLGVNVWEEEVYWTCPL
jgi:hypothetical protein